MGPTTTAGSATLRTPLLTKPTLTASNFVVI